MDRVMLEARLAAGMSLAAIGRETGRHESTVAYWVLKHGLVPAHRERHVARGRLEEADLRQLVEQGMSTGEIASATGRCKTTVRHWLREYGLATQWALRRDASAQKLQRLTLTCARHGATTFMRTGKGGYRCGKCRSEAVSRRRRRVKEALVADAGGRCVLCGYDSCLSALEFHHLVPGEKRFQLSHRGVTRSLARARAEAAKCVLLCANCHAEVEAGTATLDAPVDAGLECPPPPTVDPGERDPG
jgi:ribosomal protein S27AE